MKNKLNQYILKSALGMLIAIFAVSCSPEGWEVDYGEPKVWLKEEELMEKGEGFLGEKIVVKGTVAKVDVSDEEAAWVEFIGGTRCHFGHLFVMAESCEIGSEVYLAGILKKKTGASS